MATLVVGRAEGYGGSIGKGFHREREMEDNGREGDDGNIPSGPDMAT